MGRGRWSGEVTLARPMQNNGNIVPDLWSVPQLGGQRVGFNPVKAEAWPRRRGDVDGSQRGHGSPCLCHTWKRPSQRAGGQPAVLSCPTSWEAECSSSFAGALYRLKPADVRNNK